MFKIEDSIGLVIDIQERLMPFIYNRGELGKRAEIFIKGCRVLDLPVLAVQQYTRGLGETVPVLKSALGECDYIEKLTFSCCGCPEFIKKLEDSGRKNIIISGIEAHVCVQQTVLDLLEAKYNIYVLADCTGSRSETDCAYALGRMRDAGAVITTTESVLFELLVRADHPKRKDISNLVK